MAGEVRIRRAGERPATRLEWLDSRHTFSFGHHHDPQWMGQGRLRVLNQDVVAPNGGFDWHHHRDMEIVTYVLSGSLRHQDDMGNDQEIRQGQVQRMTAGTGVTHREWNAHDGETEFLQMWVLPTERGLPPSYDQQTLLLDTREHFAPLASPNGPVTLNAHARLLGARAPGGNTLHQELQGRAWLHVARGSVVLDGKTLAAGDGVGFEEARAIEVEVPQGAELILWDAL